MRITTVRIIVQTVVLALFLSFVLLTTFRHLDDLPGLRWVVSKFLEVDPLVALATAITTHTVYKGLIWSLVILIPTLFLGRIFCNWICPYGIIHQFIGWVFNTRGAKARIESNRYRGMFAIKYYVLIGMLVACLFGSLQIGLLDPIVFVHRAFSINVVPTFNMPAQSFFGDYKLHQLGWFVGGLFLFFVGMNLVIPRFFCRVICPLGALLGVLSRFAFWRIERDPQKCTDCDLCLQSCEGASDPHTQLRMSECFVCMNCIEDCPHDALSFAMLPPRKHEITSPDLNRRQAIFATLTGALFFSWTKASGKSTRDFSTKVVRPPGSVEETEFLERCIKCDQCIRVCPTNVLQPAMLEAGLEGIWTPIMNFRLGACQYQCTACGHVCPTGAIQRLTVEEKLGLGDYADRGPVKLGTAHYDLGRCLPWSKNIPCVVCEEVCPVSPKAIHSEVRPMLLRDGKKLIVSATATSVTLADYPKPGAELERCTFRPGEFSDALSTVHEVQILRRDGSSSMHRVRNNDADTLIVDPALDPLAQRGDTAAVYLQLALPKIDTALCIGCGICELECPVAGDRRAVYVTAEGETRSQHYQEEGRNRSLRLLKTADADGAAPAAVGTVSLTHLIAAAEAPRSGSCGSGGGSADRCGTSLHSGCGCKSPAKTATMCTRSGPEKGPAAGHKIDLRRFLT
ncbi:MAG: 4Fe-4S dicluster domain-containing protein [Planctomycetota bacterium]|jgi:polyferredoxin